MMRNLHGESAHVQQTWEQPQDSLMRIWDRPRGPDSGIPPAPTEASCGVTLVPAQRWPALQPITCPCAPPVALGLT